MYRLRSDLQRAVVDGFALPLGIEPGEVPAPTQGYTIAYTASKDEDPDTYAFYVTVSHERLEPILKRVMGLLPEKVYAVVEISSRDAYRAVDVFIGRDAISLEDLLGVWRQIEPILMEDGTIGAGANCEEPFIEVFLDQWKGISVIVPLVDREKVESLLTELGLDEVPQTWPTGEDERVFASTEIRPVLDDGDGRPDIDDLLFDLRGAWTLELNVDPSQNVDDGGRELGLTLWHAIVSVSRSEDTAMADADASIWATAASLDDMEILIEGALADWAATEIYTMDRVAFDERPDELGDLPPKCVQAEVHLVHIEPRKPSDAD